MCKGEDRDLGMHRDITRRDFVNGVGFAVTGSLLAPDWFSVFERTGYGPKVQEYYPPALTGMRGSHPGSFEVAHALRDATSWSDASATGEHTRLLALGAVREALRIDVRSATGSARAQVPGLDLGLGPGRAQAVEGVPHRHPPRLGGRG